MPLERPRSPRPIPDPLRPNGASRKTYAFRLYIAGPSGRSALALQNLQAICKEFLPGRSTIEVIDLLKHPELASVDEIIAIPTLVRLRPRPIRKVLGDLSDRSRVLLGLDILEHATT